MSSAILYLAIVAIWAGILIPRWLKHDSARAAAPAALPTSTATEPAASRPDGAAPLPYDLVAPSDVTTPDDGPSPLADNARQAPAPISREESRRHVLKARRRLLWMLLFLAVAGSALAGAHLAAWWVIMPPTVMLAGYLLLLREAAKADAEASRLERDALQARLTARSDERARRAAARQAQERAATPVPAVPVAYAAAPVPADYEDEEGPGRDFTPGRHYAAPASGTGPGAASAAVDADDDEDYDQYIENRLRAVGD
jgi:hypothetical protein